LEGIGIQNVKINELQESDLFISYENIMGIKMKSPYSFGCQKEVFINGINIKLLLKRSCFIIEKTLKANIYDLLKAFIKLFIRKNYRFMVLYENGDLYKGWEYVY